MTGMKTRGITLPEGCTLVGEAVLNRNGVAIFVFEEGDVVGPEVPEYESYVRDAFHRLVVGPVTHPAARALSNAIQGLAEEKWDLIIEWEDLERYRDQEYHRGLLELARELGNSVVVAMATGFFTRTAPPAPTEPWTHLVLDGLRRDREANLSCADWSLVKRDWLDDAFRDPHRPYAGEALVSDAPGTGTGKPERYFRTLKAAWGFLLQYHGVTPLDLPFSTFARRLNQATGRTPGRQGAGVIVSATDVLKVYVRD
jgi:hypothetical protein